MRFVSAVLVLILATSPLGAAGRSGKDVPKGGREDSVLSLITFPWQALKFDIVFMPPRVGYRAMLFSRDHRIEVYVRAEDDSRLVAYDIAHELGHAFDMTYNNAATRKKWMQARGIDPATPWFGCNRCDDNRTPAGDFAESFAYLLLGPGHFTGRIAAPPTAEQSPALFSFFPNVSFRQPQAEKSIQ